MKYNPKTKSVKLEAGEIRIGNFFVKDEGIGDLDAHIRLTDLNSTISHRVWKRLPIGIWLTHHLSKADDNSINTLKAFISVMWSFFSVVPDDAFIQDAIDATHDNFERHPEWYGGKPALRKKEDEDAADAEALKSVEEMKEFEKDVADAAKEV